MQADPQGRWVPAQLPQELLRSVPERLRGRLSLAPLAGAADGHKKGDSDSAALQRLCGRLSLAPAAEVFGGSGGGINPSALALSCSSPWPTAAAAPRRPRPRPPGRLAPMRIWAPLPRPRSVATHTRPTAAAAARSGTAFLCRKTLIA